MDNKSFWGGGVQKLKKRKIIGEEKSYNNKDSTEESENKKT